MELTPPAQLDLAVHRHRPALDEIAATLGMERTALRTRRWAMLEVLAGSPHGDGAPRTMPRIQAIRTLSFPSAMTSPRWS